MNVDKSTAGSVLGFILLTAWSAAAAPEINIRSGERVGFIGDSITQFGVHGAGWITLLQDAWERAGLEDLDMAVSGTGGGTAEPMFNKQLPPLLAGNPDWLFISCGVNDARVDREGNRPISFSTYTNYMTRIFDTVRDAGVKAVVLSATVVGEDRPDSRANTNVAEINSWLEEQAGIRGLPYVDMMTPIREGRERGWYPDAKIKMRYKYTTDGIHMNPRGDRLRAVTILRAMGWDQEVLARLNEEWKDIPDGVSRNIPDAAMSGRDYERLEAYHAVTGKGGHPMPLLHGFRPGRTDPAERERILHELFTEIDRLDLPEIE